MNLDLLGKAVARTDSQTRAKGQESGKGMTRYEAFSESGEEFRRLRIRQAGTGSKKTAVLKVRVENVEATVSAMIGPWFSAIRLPGGRVRTRELRGKHILVKANVGSYQREVRGCRGPGNRNAQSGSLPVGTCRREREKGP